MKLKLNILTYIIFWCIFFTTIGYAGEAELILDAGEIEWDGEYLTAKDGFELWLDDKYMKGDELYLDLDTKKYFFNHVSFTGCKKESPHYLIIAKGVKFYPEEKIIFSGVKVKIGKIVFPLPMNLVLKYRDGEYRFPNWFPEIFYSGEKGAGIRIKGFYDFSSDLYAETVLEATTTGDVSFKVKGNYKRGEKLILNAGADYDQEWTAELNGNYLIGYGFALGGGVEYDQEWAGNLILNWRQNKEGFRGSVNWSWKNDEEVYFGYLKNGWHSKINVSRNPSGKITPILEVNSPKLNLFGIDYSIMTGVTKVTEKTTTAELNKLYITTSFSDQYMLGQTKLGWSFNPTHVRVDNYGIAGKSKSNIWVQSSLGKRWNLRLGYGRTDRWGVILPAEFDEYTKEEYVEGRLMYHYRNELDEGWDLELKGQYSLESKEYTLGQMRVVRAYDCFDLKAEVDFIDLFIEMGVRLKY
ncbi:hypothetical protein BBF96_11360 [Anoxybacter fermentans]|uniref:Uncharacterized protein n=1 Tax=Anoxybacter fermentans TaxID=1323375 RepID=A0A3Q9HRQ3_9FIRM|nr:hypothetical protein [Anoxybacter fermentans]AZR73936.1 hypothetical protein BBF96_11360 [Anoxybacter fermentans]